VSRRFDKKEIVINILLTIIQYVTLILFIIISPRIAKGIIPLTVEILGVILAIWAIIEMRKSKLNIAPLPRSGATVVSSGPYKLIRHPMYLSIILALTPLIVTHFDVTRLIVLLLLYINLIVKMFFEESIIKKHLNGYNEYSKSTKRLFPYIF
jgi:protein-S-isoprenylcysteine O-methyltransferase Ste14